MWKVTVSFIAHTRGAGLSLKSFTPVPAERFLRSSSDQKRGRCFPSRLGQRGREAGVRRDAFVEVPCYSYGQKLSKLAILRIACNYILSLARLADLDYSADHSNMSFSECVEQCTRTLQAEGRSKKRKE
ncbi:PREDICTED: protein atonal homolog 8 [Aptenodytes forsteri]|uniref:protein atonal homolog 8 n=1 Tax=Aptenodytes forsteri TaxID=9233 RepID=UPI0004F4A4DF|nr:PREDICTED: protein atonal homolog 8 [Aptenodytes forsteri]